MPTAKKGDPVNFPGYPHEVLAVVLSVRDGRLRRGGNSTGSRPAPYLTRMLAVGNYPAPAETIREAGHLDAAAAFDLGLDFLLGGIEANLP